MKIVVFGAGSLGSLVGGLLTRRHDVTLIGRPAHMKAIEESGLVITGMVEAVVVPRTAERVSDVPEADMVLITVKAYDTAKALAEIKPIVNSATRVVSLQNGLSNPTLLDKAYPWQSVIGVTNLGATKSGNGRVFYAGEGDTYFGTLRAPRNMAEEVAEIFTSVGMDAFVSDDIMREVWIKAIVNSAINPLTAIVRCKNGKLLQDEDLRELCHAVCREGEAIAKACGRDLGDKDPFALALDILRKTAENRSSMLQDVEKRRRTEIEEITGELVRKGEENGVQAQVNKTLWHLIRSLSRYQ
ncbi:MAG: 2-dehydropantoate 2-reductase [Methanomassiliicoccales archaeon]